jgi:hypothetical protein
MKRQIINSTMRVYSQFHVMFRLQKAIFYCTIIFTVVLLATGCSKTKSADDAFLSGDLASQSGPVASSVDNDCNNDNLQSTTIWELQQAKAATARYRDLKNAEKDGYQDINVVTENMGYHYMKTSQVDAEFDIRKPEILVYSKDDMGKIELVAVEYAIPLSVTPNAAPAGFTGDNDVWSENKVFGLWLLHAWVWKCNPKGVFNPTNELVHLH